MATTKISDYKIGYTDQFFFDTNVWLLLFGTFADFQDKDQKHYSKFLEELITKDKAIFVSSMILSEFSNVILRKNFNQWITNNKFVGKKFKEDFVKTIEYKTSVESITIAINKILKLPNVTRTGDNFNAVDMSYILESFKLVDFNDSYIAGLSLLNDYKVVTNDADFKLIDAKLNVITTQI
jgi:predicted nucleic acid-binding protein